MSFLSSIGQRLNRNIGQPVREAMGRARYGIGTSLSNMFFNMSGGGSGHHPSDHPLARMHKRTVVAPSSFDKAGNWLVDKFKGEGYSRGERFGQSQNVFTKSSPVTNILNKHVIPRGMESTSGRKLLSLANRLEAWGKNKPLTKVTALNKNNFPNFFNDPVGPNGYHFNPDWSGHVGMRSDPLLHFFKNTASDKDMNSFKASNHIGNMDWSKVRYV